jgi:nicotinate-nucleotide--dimethylbenzimidazole phosphoribosyltransferase
VGEALAAGGRTVIDVGVAGCLTERPGLIIRKIRAGTRDFTAEPALTVDEACAAIEIGIGAADNAVDGGARVLRTATLGVASAPSVRAILKVMTPSRDLGNLFVGSDAGNSKIADAAVLHGIARHRPDRCDPLAVLAAFGGLEQAALVGFILAAAAHRVPVIIDGMDGESAVAVAVALAPAAAAVVTYPEPAPWASQALSGQGDGGGQR